MKISNNYDIRYIWSWKASVKAKELTLKKYFLNSENILSQVILGLIVSRDLEVKQLDMKTTFLHRNLKKEIYMK